MELNVEKLADAAMRTVGKMDAEDVVAMKVCLLSTGALAGLSVKNKFLRRLTGLTCTVLAVGLAVPLASRYLEELREGDEAASSFAGAVPKPGEIPFDASSGGVTAGDFDPEQE